jgi:hypothetical protein
MTSHGEPYGTASCGSVSRNATGFGSPSGGMYRELR